jgi:molybdate transport system substrate-binding protein
VAIGFQQLSELTHVAGIDVIGRLPPGAELMTYFTAAVSRNSAQSEAALKLLKFLTNAEHDALKRSHGLDPV